MAIKRTLIGNIKGPKGDTGAQGPQGATGPGATIEVGTVSTTAYGNTAQVTNSGTATAAVLDFVIPQGKPGEQTTKMSGLTLDTVTASTAEYPTPATGDTGSVAWGKVIKFFNDAKTAIASKINITDIVNNLTSTATNKPLSAAQGKALNDAITILGTRINTNTASTNVSIPVGSWTNVNQITVTAGTWLVYAIFASPLTQSAVANKRIVCSIGTDDSYGTDLETNGGPEGRIRFVVSKIIRVQTTTNLISRMFQNGTATITLARGASSSFNPTDSSNSSLYAVRIGD